MDNDFAMMHASVLADHASAMTANGRSMLEHAHALTTHASALVESIAATRSLEATMRDHTDAMLVLADRLATMLGMNSSSSFIHQLGQQVDGVLEAGNKMQQASQKMHDAGAAMHSAAVRMPR